MKWTKQIIGPRIIKTGLATFLTALFCQLLHLPATFAVIASLVSIEPTAKASLRKAFIRFPASILGAFIAVTSAYFLGESPLAYSIAATLTIVICYQLKLHDGMLVASLTAAAMIPNIHDDFVFNFFSRLVTTTIGLTTAGLVNFLVLPPKYQLQIETLINNVESELQQLFIARGKEVLIGHFHSKDSVRKLNHIDKMITKIEQLIQYEHEEFQYHQSDINRKKLMMTLEKRLQFNRLYIIHLTNMIYMPQETAFDFHAEERQAYTDMITAMQQHEPVPRAALSTFKSSVKHLAEFDDNQLKSHYIYELLMIQKLLTEQHADYQTDETP
ncbi:FUSC family protein [Macrococcus equipercicus]|uniref:Aromatic acid exporter family protein n=1 Tax=Macrococcus equipercicus TaxID=69967 RepID=A0A9Q9BLJ8_9STAP|nr:aromatic acid exporter family protein [Macrococcus equipercicus]UTH13400.1 aromatic acid exporter family protein [Macrococcus equipercicus]